MIVRDDVDRRKRLDWLRRTVETYGWRLHAFVLMNNHDHLFVETPEANLSAGMQHYNGSYTGYCSDRRRSPNTASPAARRRIENGTPKLQPTAEKLERQLLNP